MIATTCNAETLICFSVCKKHFMMSLISTCTISLVVLEIGEKLFATPVLENSTPYLNNQHTQNAFHDLTYNTMITAIMEKI